MKQTWKRTCKHTRLAIVGLVGLSFTLNSPTASASNWDTLLASVNRGDFGEDTGGKLMRDAVRAVEQELARCKDRETLESSFDERFVLVAKGFPWKPERPGTRQMYFDHLMGSIREIVPIVLECSRGTPCDPKVLATSRLVVESALNAFDEDLATSVVVPAAMVADVHKVADSLIREPVLAGSLWYGMPLGADYPDRMRRAWYPLLNTPQINGETAELNNQLVAAFIAELRAIETQSGGGCDDALMDVTIEWWNLHPELYAQVQAFQNRPRDFGRSSKIFEEDENAFRAEERERAISDGVSHLRTEAAALMAKIRTALDSLPTGQQSASFVVEFAQGAIMRIDCARQPNAPETAIDAASLWSFSCPRAMIQKFDTLPVTLVGREEFAALFAGAEFMSGSTARWTFAWEGETVALCVIGSEPILGALGGINELPLVLRTTARSESTIAKAAAGLRLSLIETPREISDVLCESAAIQAVWHAKCSGSATERAAVFAALVRLEACEWSDGCAADSAAVSALRQEDAALALLESSVDDPFRIAWLAVMHDRARTLPACLAPKVIDALTGWELRRNAKSATTSTTAPSTASESSGGIE